MFAKLKSFFQNPYVTHVLAVVAGNLASHAGAVGGIAKIAGYIFGAKP